MKSLWLFGSVARLENASWLDPAARRVRGTVNAVIRP